MVLTEQQIKDIIIKNPGKELVAAAAKKSRELKKHIDGIGIDAAIETISGFEDLSLRNLRAKYARSNKDLMSRLARPMDKIFSAKGGSVYYNLSEAEDKKIRQFAKDIRSGYSIKAWIENFWKPNFLKDPNGFIFMEMYSDKQAVQYFNAGKSVVYPTYKNITCVYDYMTDGNRLQYVVFKTTAAEKEAIGKKPEDIVYRVVDDAADYYVHNDNGTAIILTEFTLSNLFNEVPAILNSDIADSNRPGLMKSIFDEVIELADHFLMKNSIKVTHDFMHAFPKYWEYASECNKCGGKGFFDGKDCEDCKGTGKKTISKVSDVKLLPMPTDKEQPVIAPHVAGYVSPDKIFYDIAVTDLRMLEDLMHYTIWGAASKIKTIGEILGGAAPKTATEIMDDIKPQADRLFPLSDMAATRHKFIIDAVVKINITQNYQGASVSYGKRYMLEGPDEVWDKYSEARKSGAAISILDDLLIEYYETKYNTDPVKMAIQVKLMKVEPWVHYTTSEIQRLDAGESEYKAKLFFGEWLSTQNELHLLTTNETTLRNELMAYTGRKQLRQEAAPAV
jgi:hypothetical protein